MNVPTSPATMGGCVGIWTATTPASVPPRMWESSASSVSSPTAPSDLPNGPPPSPHRCVFDLRPQGAPLCWGWRAERSPSLRSQPPPFTTAFSASSVGAPTWRASTTRASSTRGRRRATTGNPGSRFGEGGAATAPLGGGWR